MAISAATAWTVAESCAGLLPTGMWLYTKACGEPVPSYFTEVLKDIQKFMHQEITAEKQAEIDAKIKGVDTWIKNTYIPQKEHGLSKRQLHQRLQSVSDHVATNLIPVLQQRNFAESSLPVFISGACLHLFLLHELCQLDPDVTDPSRSPFSSSLKLYARDYANYAEDRFHKIAERRKEMITGEFRNASVFILVWCRGTLKDQLTGKEIFRIYDWPYFDMDPEAREREAKREFEEKRGSYIRRVGAELVEQMNDPLTFISECRELANNQQPSDRLQCSRGDVRLRNIKRN